MIEALFILWFALMNRVRGSQMFGLFSSTTEGRLVGMAGMALATTWRMALPDVDAEILVFALSLAFLYAWTIPGWDAYWGAAIGDDPKHSKWWGVWYMTLRMSLLMPFYSLLAGYKSDFYLTAYGLSFLLMGLPYLLAGVFLRGRLSNYIIAIPELINGAIIGATVWMIA